MNINYAGRDQFFYASVFLYAVSLPFSEFMISLSAGLLLVSLLLTGRFSEKWKKLKSQSAALLIVSVFLVYVGGAFFTKNQSLALYELQKTAFILIIPLCISAGPPIGYKLLRKILFSFLAALNIASFLALARLAFRDQLAINDIWEILFVSHIGFSFQLLLGISVLINELYNHRPARKTIYYLLVANILYLIFFLFILKSLTGLVTFALLLIAHLFFVIRKIRNQRWKQVARVMLPVSILSGFLYIGWCVYHFYDTEPVNPALLPEKTMNGNLYHHEVKNKLLENGHYVGLYLCEEELRKSWEERSSFAYDENDRNGFPVSATLIRYLTSKGLTKDSAGMSKLLPEEIHFIEKGIANHIYTRRFLSLYPRIYQTIWELDVYFKTGNPNYKSLAQRIEFGKAALTIIKKHPLFGVGTGNWKQEFADAYSANHSKLEPVQYGSSHNQYLNYMVKFGVIGLLWILFAWIYPLFLKNKQHFYPAVILLLTLGIANFSDSNLEAHMGISFFVFFYSIFLFSETEPTPEQ